MAKRKFKKGSKRNGQNGQAEIKKNFEEKLFDKSYLSKLGKLVASVKNRVTRVKGE